LRGFALGPPGHFLSGPGLLRFSLRCLHQLL